MRFHTSARCEELPSISVKISRVKSAVGFLRESVPITALAAIVTKGGGEIVNLD
jgi:hypothetical protein